MQTNANKTKQQSSKQRKSWLEMQGKTASKTNKPAHINKREKI